MDEITLVRDGAPDLLPMRDRSPGYHVSSILRYICIRMGHFDESGVLDMARLQLGCALEHAIAHRFSLDDPDRYIQPGELELDGIFGHLDLLDVHNGLVKEIKLTWVSSNHEPDGIKFWKWWAQAKSYCKMIGVDQADLEVVFMRGDYLDHDLPIWRTYSGRFTRSSLNENWALMRSAAPMSVKEG